MAIKEYKYLSPEQRQQFVEKGWVKIENAVPQENIDRFMKDVWVRLGMDPNDPKTWTKETIHMPAHKLVKAKEFTPKGWGAICEILGGEDKIDDKLFDHMSDAMIVNLGNEEVVDKDIEPDMLGNWHIDGDWFVHFLDSGDQAVTVIVLFNDIVPRAGGTYLAPDGIGNVVKWLYEHPEGAETWPLDETGARTVCDIHNAKEFVEVTGKKGDIVIMHPFMPHSKSKNYLRVPRFITNPPITLKEPLNLNRENPEDYTLTELNILRHLGVDRLPDWHITAPRRRFTPRTRAGKEALINDEVARLKAHAAKTGEPIDSIHINGKADWLEVKPTEVAGTPRIAITAK